VIKLIKWLYIEKSQAIFVHTLVVAKAGLVIKILTGRVAKLKEVMAIHLRELKSQLEMSLVKNMI